MSSSFREVVGSFPLSHSWSDDKNKLTKIGQFKLVTFNMLAPCYKRLEDRRQRETDVGWQGRADQSVAFFERELLQNFQLVSLQEYWLNEEYSKMFKRLATRLGFSVYSLRRHPTRKEDAVAIMVQTSVLQVKGYDNVFLCAESDRVALLVHLVHRETKKNIIVANTHLSFPHTDYDRKKQMRQMEHLLSAMERFSTDKCRCPDASKIVMGDFNVECHSGVCDLLREQGYLSCMETSPANITVGDDKVSSKFVSHRTHRHEDLGVDHIFFKPEIFEVDGTDHGLLGSLFAADSTVLPQSSPCTAWDEGFDVSDHRPVGSTLKIGIEKRD